MIGSSSLAETLVQNCSIWGVWGTCTAVCSELDPGPAYWAQWHYLFMDSTRILRTVQPTKLFFLKQEINLIPLITCLIQKHIPFLSPSEPPSLVSSNHSFYLCFMALFFFLILWLALALYMASDFTPLYSLSVGSRQWKLFKKNPPKAKEPLLVKGSCLTATKTLEGLGKGFWPDSDETALMTGILPKTAQFQLLDTMVPAWTVQRRWETFLLMRSQWTGSQVWGRQELQALEMLPAIWIQA